MIFLNKTMFAKSLPGLCKLDIFVRCKIQSRMVELHASYAIIIISSRAFKLRLVYRMGTLAPTTVQHLGPRSHDDGMAAQTESNLGPLITAFPLDQDCSSQHIGSYNTRWRKCETGTRPRCNEWGSEPSVRWSLLLDEETHGSVEMASSSCFPDKYQPEHGFYYSPGLECPSGYTTACTRWDTRTPLKIDAIFTCCPAFDTSTKFSCVDLESLAYQYITQRCIWSDAGGKLPSNIGYGLCHPCGAHAQLGQLGASRPVH